MGFSWADLPCLLALGAAAAAGCGDAGGSGSGACTPDPERLVEGRACVQDDACPCGSSCLFGRCASECDERTACPAGKRCEARFGRCVADGEDGAIALPTVRAREGIRLSSETVSLREGEARLLSVVSDAEGERRVRLSVTEGFEVACESGRFAPSCFLVLESGVPKAFTVRPARASGADRGRLAVHPRRGRPVYVSLSAGPGLVRAPAWRPLEEGARLRGYASPLATGVEGRSEEIGAEELPRVPIRADLYPSGSGRQVLVLHDPLRWLWPQGRLVARLEETSLHVPAWVQIDEAESGVPEAEIIAQPTVTGLIRSPSAIAFEMTVHYVGASPRSPYLRLVVELQRSGGAPGGDVPRVPASRAPRFAPSRRNVPLPWEAAAHAECGGRGCDPSDASRFACAETLSDVRAYETSSEALSSGDPRCRRVDDAVDLDRAFAPGYLSRLDAVVRGGATLGRAQVVRDCWEDLIAMQEAPPGGASGYDLSARGCFAPLRFHGRMAALAPAVLQAESPSPQVALRALRLLQQLVEASSFLGSELLQAGRFQRALGGECGSAPCPDTLGEPRDLVLRPFAVVNLLLHPRYGEVWQRVAPFQGADGAPDASLAYSLLRAGLAQARLTISLLDDAWRQGTASEADYVERVLQRMWFWRLLASASALDAGEGSGLSEAERQAFEGQLGAFDEAFSRLAAHRLASHLGANPLDVPPGKVPLYLDRDVERPEARAFALTNYLLDPEGRNWIGQAVERAQQAQSMVRDAWALRLQLDAAALAQASSEERYRQSVSRAYGRRILELCPLEGMGDTEVVEALSAGELQIDPERCFLETDNPRCAAFATPSSAGPREVARDVCLAARMRLHSPLAGVPGDADVNGFLDMLREALDGGASVEVRPRGEGWLVVAGAVSQLFSLEQLAALSLGVSGGEGGAALSGFAAFDPREMGPSRIEDLDGWAPLMEAQQRCEAVADAVEGGPPPVAPATPEALDTAACYRGLLGEVALGTRGARTDLDAAQARLQEAYERYRIAVGSCRLVQQASDVMAAETARFEQSVAGKQKAISDMRIAASVFDIVSGTLADSSTASGFQGAGPKGSGALAGATAVASVTSGVLNIVADEMQAEVDAMAAEHEAYMALIQQELELRRCMNEASRELVGLRSASLGIRRAAQELERNALRLRNLQDELRGLLRSGVKAATDPHGARPYAGTLWLEESLGLFEQRMRVARRVSYLAALAVDYERQECDADGFRERVLRADTPSELSAVRDDMLASVADRQVGNGTIGDAFVVVSLRDDILQLADRTEAQPGEQTLGSIDRLRLLLTDPRFALYERGVYKGQLVSFDLVPPGAASSGYSVGEGYFSQSQCAERLWSLNVGIVGEEGVSGSSTLTRVEILKDNDFYSRWCRPEAACTGSAYQQGSINPADNLFLDPRADASFLEVPTDAPAPYSRVVLNNVRTDVRRADVERADYAQGAQRGFAGRGLFGHYALFFPADVLLLDCEGDCGSSAGNALDLSKVDDVLIRFDYVAGVRP